MKKRFYVFGFTLLGGATISAIPFVNISNHLAERTAFWEQKVKAEIPTGPPPIWWIEKNHLRRMVPKYATEVAGPPETFLLEQVPDAGIYPCTEWEIELHIDYKLGKSAVYPISSCNNPSQPAR